MKLSIVENEKPNLANTEMLCDMELHKKLNKFELTKFMNKNSANLLCGRPGSGKTSLLFSMFKSPDIFKKVFHNIYLFQPFASASSVKNNIFDKIPDEQKFDDLTPESLGDVMDILSNEDKKYNNCIIFDDVTVRLKDKEVEKLLKQLIFNRRHMRCSIFFLVQSYKSVPSQIRKMFSNLFIFKTSKQELEEIREEILETVPRQCIGQLSQLVYDKPHQFLFINGDSQTLMKGFDKIIIHEDKEI
jgi:hypothetical protein